MPVLSVRLELEKETKNTVRYEERPEDGQPPRIGTLYIQKWALPTPHPKAITVTVEEG